MQNHSQKNALYAVLFFTGVYIIGISYLSIIRYQSFSASVYDLGIMIQTIWNTSEGWFLQESINMGRPMMRFWMAHWEFIYVFFAAVYKVFSTPATILILQTLFVALGAIPLYWLAQEKLENNLAAVIFPLSYLLHSAIQNANLCDIHGVTLAAPFLMYAFYFLQAKKYKWFMVHAILALLCREDSALILLMMGGYAFVFTKDKKFAMIVMAISVVWFTVWYTRMEIRSILGLPEFVIMEGADSHWAHLANIKDDPLYLIKFWLKKRNIYYFVNLLGPVGFLSLLSPCVFLISSPILVINMISGYYYTHDIEHHYSATIVPFIYLSAVIGLGHALDFMNSKQRRLLIKVIPWVILVLSVAFFCGKSNVFDAKHWKVTQHHRITKKIIQQIPQTASLTTDSRLAAHAAERHEIYVLPDHVDDADFILYDFHAPLVELITRESFKQPALWADNDLIRKILANRDYGIVNYEDGIALFQKGADYVQGLHYLAVVADATEISKKLDVDITTMLRCNGIHKHGVLLSYSQPDPWGPVFWKKAIHFTCYWQVNQDYPENFDFVFEFKNGSQSWQLSHSPVFDVFTPSMWVSDEIIRDEVVWELPEAAPPGIYQVSVGIQIEGEYTEFVYLFDIQVE